jgi:hypothetical protein
MLDFISSQHFCQALNPRSAELPEDRQYPTSVDMGHMIRSSTLEAVSSCKVNKPTSNMGDDPSGNCSRGFDRLWPQEQSYSVTYSPIWTRQSTCTESPFNATYEAETIGNNKTKYIENIYQSIPPPVDATRTIREHHIAHVASDCE